MWQQRFEELQTAALRLLEPVTTVPLTIYVEQTAEEKRFHLREADRHRIAGWASPETVASTVSVREDVESEFSTIHGTLYPHVAEWLTGLSKDALFALGGVRFLRDGQTLWEWPAR